MLTINLPELGIGKTAYTVKTITQTLKAYNLAYNGWTLFKNPANSPSPVQAKEISIQWYYMIFSHILDEVLAPFWSSKIEKIN